MKRFYSRFRIMLMTFALGLASVYVFDNLLNFSNEVFVNLPEAKSAKVIVISPNYSEEIPKIDGVIKCNR